MVKIDFVSDLHMEINGNHYIKGPESSGDVMILAGDTLTYRHMGTNKNDPESRSLKKRFEHFIKNVLRDYEHIIFIPGNHEYYGFYFKGADEWFAQQMKELDSRIIVLDGIQSAWFHNDIDKYTIIGGTLWTSMNNGNPLSEMAVEEGMNDYHVINYEDARKPSYVSLKQPGGERNILRGRHTKEVFDKTVKNIKTAYELFNTEHNRIIVATHHAPSYQSHSFQRFGHSDLMHGYCSNLDDFIVDSNIKYWIHGHTHHNVDYMIGETRVISAMYGYNGHERDRNRPLTVGRIVL